MDREKVIKWLNVCKTSHYAVGIKEDYPCRLCPYYEKEYCMKELISDALELLKEHEAVEPLPQNSNGWVRTITLWYCGACHAKISRRTSKYCPNCGKPILWEGR